MEILSAEQIRLWDEYTIAHEPIASIDLMERAAEACVDWMDEHALLDKSFVIYCGKGNNGGDGLAIARLLNQRQCLVAVHILEFGHKGTDDFQLNLARLHGTGVDIKYIQTTAQLHIIPQGCVVIDALFGSGLNRPLEGFTAKLIDHINASGAQIVSIDIPSGLYVDRSSQGNPVIHANSTLSFQCYKPAFLVAENHLAIGRLFILDIGLLPEFLLEIRPENKLADLPLIRSKLLPRSQFAHKGQFGHALIVAGSTGKMGAAIMAATACLRSGAGLLTCHLPAAGCAMMQTGLPEAMVEPDQAADYNTNLPANLAKYSVLGIGPGLGTAPETASMMGQLLKFYPKPMVIDADALNILSAHPEFMSLLPSRSILTPHPKEFERLFGPAAHDFERLTQARQQAKALGCIVILKGHYTFTATPSGTGYFNSTGNAGMAKGGSGDVLTGILTGLLSQGYEPEDAAVIGVFLHGLAGDIAAECYSEQAMLPTDLIGCLGQAFNQITEAMKP